MTNPLSMDLRSRAMARLAAGESVRAVAAALSVAPSSVVKWSLRLRRTGSVAPGKIGGHVRPKIAGEHRAWLIGRIGAEAFTLRGLVAELAALGLKVDYRTMWKFVHAHGLSFKKTVLASEQDRADVARQRQRWKARQASVDPRRLVLSTRPGPRPTWGRCGVGGRAANGSEVRCRTAAGRR